MKSLVIYIFDDEPTVTAALAALLKETYASLHSIHTFTSLQEMQKY